MLSVLLLGTIVSCKDDPEPEPTLKGTIWKLTDSRSYDGRTYTVTEVFEFTSETSGIYKRQNTYDSNLDVTVVFTYLYNDPTVTMSSDRFEGGVWTGSVNGNVLVIANYAYQKQ